MGETDRLRSILQDYAFKVKRFLAGVSRRTRPFASRHLAQCKAAIGGLWVSRLHWGTADP